LIYVAPTAPDIRQGDIFTSVPFVDFSLTSNLFYVEGSATPLPWPEAVASGKRIAGSLIVQPRVAMLISQDCDVARDQASATLCVIDRFEEVHKPAANVTSPKRRQQLITKGAVAVAKWFYLPADPMIVELQEKSAADFRVTTRVSIRDLKTLRRVASINDVAREHLRQRVAHFFQRYAVDEWYALDDAELDSYREEHGDVKTFPWQRG
jgi:hypothetical protein